MKQLFLCSYFAGVKKLFSDYAKEKNLENKVLFINNKNRLNTSSLCTSGKK